MSQSVRARGLHPPGAGNQIRGSRWGGPSTTVARVTAIAVATLVTVGVNAVAAHFLVEPYNPGFLEHPVVTRAHVLLGGIYLAGAPWQFVRRFRRRRLGYHRWAGRALTGIGLVVGASALFLGLVVPFSGDPERVVIGIFGALFLVSLVLGVVRVRQGRIDQHREWMIRAFAIGLSVATMRLLFIPALVLVGDPTDAQVAGLSVTSFAVAFVLHASAAELLIRATRQTPGQPRDPHDQHVQHRSRTQHTQEMR